jgi:hypothetical protein
MQPLGGRNAIWLQSRQKLPYWATEIKLNIIPLSGIGNQADEAMNSGHNRQCFYVGRQHIRPRTQTKFHKVF